MNYWLLKSDPDNYNWEDLIKEGTTMWDGVRNYQARNFIRQMKKGDIAFFYHSVTNPGIVGLAEIIKEYYPDPTATEGDWSVVNIKPIRKLNKFISLQEIKQKPALQNMVLLKNPRLSVQPVSEAEYNSILKIC